MIAVAHIVVLSILCNLLAVITKNVKNRTMAKTIEEKAKDLCSDISNILIHHYKGHTTEFAEAKAVEDAEELINTIKQEIVKKACEWLEDVLFFGEDGICIGSYTDTIDSILNNFRNAMEEE